MTPNVSEPQLRKVYSEAGQDHVFTFYDSLSDSDQSKLLLQLASIDPQRVNSIYKKATSAASSSAGDEQISPPPSDSYASLLTDNQVKAKEWYEVGLESVRSGKVGVLLLAGGQGTRLGSSAPKGCYNIGLPSKKSLFQLQAERIARLQSLAGGVTVPWYVMTSGPTRKATEDFFRQNSFFGLVPEQVIFFEQGVLPALTNDGKFFLDTKSSVAVAPDGNGGLYAGLRSPSSAPSSRSVLADLSSRGILYVHAYCVDNCLVKVADPVFLGYCITSQADCGAKVVRKEQPAESVGVVALRNGKWGVAEYSEIPKGLTEQRDPDGNLTFRAANIANHFYTTEFLESVQGFEAEMAYHVANKKIPHVDLSSGSVTKPSSPNGMKLELFIFDVFPFTKRMAVLEVPRQEEFSPLKNAPGSGSDDPETSRKDLLQQQKRWLEAAGAKVEAEVEVSPLASYGGEGLESAKGLTLKKSGTVEKAADLETLA